MRSPLYTFILLEKRAPPTQWRKTLPVTVGESRVFQQACGRLHSSCEIHFGSTRGDGNGSDVDVTHLTSKNSGSEVVTRLIIWSTHGELFLWTMRRTVTIAQSSTPKARHDQHAQCCRPWKLPSGSCEFCRSQGRASRDSSHLKQCASAPKEVGKDNLDTGLMITSTHTWLSA